MADQEDNPSDRGSVGGSKPPGGTSRYAIERQIGAGGMGEVYLAHDAMLDRNVALKFLPEAVETDDVARRRFLREAKSAAALDHPYICKIYELGELDGRSFIAMEFVDGETLADRIEKGPLAAVEAVRLAIEIIEGLETAHAAGIVHRDLKPANIMITATGHAKVMDFGLAKRLDAPAGRETRFETASRLTGTGALMGTPAYMSPEQLRGEGLDARSDTFALGVVLHEMLTGSHPFAGGSAMDTIAAILNEEPASLGRHPEPLPELLAHIAAKMTAKSPDERYQQIREARIDLSRVDKALEAGSVAGGGQPRVPGAAQSIGTMPASVGSLRGPKATRTPHVLAGAAFLAVIAVAAWWTASTSDAPGAPATDSPRYLAILPFTALGGAPDEEVLATGLPGSIATRLINVGVPVLPADSVRLAYGDGTRPAAEVAADLGADLALTGELQLFDDGRVNARLELIDPGTRTSIWSDNFDSSITEVFAMITEISTEAAGALEVELTGEAREILATAETQDPDALDYYYRGARALLMAASPDEMGLAITYFERALSLDPELAEAHLGIGATLAAQFWEGGQDTAVLYEAERYYVTARDLAPSSWIAMRARRALMVLYFLIGEIDYPDRVLGEWRDGIPHADPDDGESLLTFAIAMNFGLRESEAALIALDRLLESDPYNAEASFWGYHAAWPVSPASTDRYVARHLEVARDAVEARMYQAFAHHRIGDLARAVGFYDTVWDLVTNDNLFTTGTVVPEYFVFAGIAHDQAGRRDRAEETWQTGLDIIADRMLTAPTSQRLMLIAAALHGLLGEPDRMEAVARPALARPGQEYSVTVLAAVYAQLGNLDEAIRLIEGRTQRLPAYFPQFYRMATGRDVNDEPRLQRIFVDAESRVEAIKARFRAIDYEFGARR